MTIFMRRRTLISKSDDGGSFFCEIYNITPIHENLIATIEFKIEKQTTWGEIIGLYDTSGYHYIESVLHPNGFYMPKIKYNDGKKYYTYYPYNNPIYSTDNIIINNTYKFSNS